MKKRLLTNIMVLLASLSLSLVAAEIFLRSFLPEDMSTSWRLRVPNPELGWSLQPDVSYHYRMVRDLIPVQHNSKGFHDTEHSYENPAGVPRIVVLGDSFMEAFSVQSQETFYGQLENRLKEAGKPAEVINLGVGGYGTLQEYLVYMKEGRRYHPEDVVLGFYMGNDLRNNDRELESMVNAGDMKSTSRPFLIENSSDGFAISTVDYDGAMERYNAALQSGDTLLHRLAKHIAIFRALEMADNRLFPDQDDSGNAAAEKKQQEFAALGMHFCSEPAAFTRAWRNTRRILERLNAEVRASGAELLIFTVPAEHEVSPAAMRSATDEFYDPGALCLDAAPAYKRLKMITEELGINYVDLLPEFRQQALAGTDFYLADHHWNAAGHSLAAERVAGVLLEQTVPGQ